MPGARPDRKPYTDETLARAIREGVDSEGRRLSTLMPRYALDDSDLAALISHLRSLDRRRVPGVSDTELRFATIITPDADPAKRRGMLDVLQHFFEDRNNTQRLPLSQNMMPSGNAFRVKGMFKVTRRWVLQVWEPTGPKSTWTAQLAQKFAAQPVFAVLSGLGGDDRTPVQAFCEQNAVPCLFPNVDLPPVDAEHEFYSLYFSRGVRLEADLIGQALTQPGIDPSSRKYGSSTDKGHRRSGRCGARGDLAVRGHPRYESRRCSRCAAKAVAATVTSCRQRGAGVVAAARRPRRPRRSDTPGRVYLSELMSDIDSKPLPAEWRGAAHIAYPFDLPESRRVRVDYARGWFRIRGIPLVDEQSRRIRTSHAAWPRRR